MQSWGTPGGTTACASDYPEGMLLLLAACTNPGDTGSEWECNARGLRTLESGTVVQLSGEGVPVVMVVGSYAKDQIPSDHAPKGFLRIAVGLPGGGETPGEYDRFGAGSRSAVAAALRYAGGLERDVLGCTLSGPVLLAGGSNAGNLMVSTLADEEVELPEVLGLVTWETPIGPQFILDELEQPETGSCALGETLTCAFDGSKTVTGQDWSWLDREENGVHDQDEPILDGLMVGVLRVHSPVLTEQLEENVFVHPAAFTEAWFAQRDAGVQAGGAAARFPDLKVIVTGSEQDHVQDVPGNPHVYGLASLFSEAGLWVRLNPDAEFTGQTTDNDANVAIGLEGPGELLPVATNADELLTAGVLELIQRLEDDNWSSQL